MSAASALTAGRRAIEALMVDECTITRVTGETTDRETGHTVRSTSEIYTGRCRIQQREAQGRRDDVGEASIVQLRLELALPMSVVGLASGDQVTITAAAHDEDLVDRRFTVQDIAHKTHATARRIQVTEVTS